MHHHYSSTNNQDCQDVERQACHHHIQDSCHPTRYYYKKNNSKWPLVIFILLGLLFISNYHRHGIRINNQPINESNISIMSSSIPSLPILWNGKSVYEVPQGVKSVHIKEKRPNAKFAIETGKVDVTVNENIDQTKIALDISLSDDYLQNAIQVDEIITTDDYQLNIIHSGEHFRGRAKINILIELPNANALDNLDLGFINEIVTIKNQLQLENTLSINVVKGQINVEHPIKATTIIQFSVISGNIYTYDSDLIASIINLKVESGNINGKADLIDGQVNISTTSGNINLNFAGSSTQSDIKINSVSGNINLQMPSDFYNTFELSTLSGNIDVGARDTSVLSFVKIRHVVGMTIKGKYGDQDNLTSRIESSTISGNIYLSYQ